MATKLYVGNFPWSTTEDDLRNVFEQYVEIRSIKLVMDRETGRSRGFAFIEFADADACQEAMDVENGRDLNGRELKVREAVDKPRGESRDNREQRTPRPRPQIASQEQQRSSIQPTNPPNNAGKRHREHRQRRDDRDYGD